MQLTESAESLQVQLLHPDGVVADRQLEPEKLPWVVVETQQLGRPVHGSYCYPPAH